MLSAPTELLQQRPIRVLHSIGHLLRGGIETWLYTMILGLDKSRFEHDVLVRTNEEEPFTSAFREAGARVLACTGYRSPIRYAISFRRLVREYGPYDVLHIHGSNLNGFLSLLLAKRMGIKTCIVHSHNDIRPLLKERSFAYRAYVACVHFFLRRLPDMGFAASVLAAESMFGDDWKKDPRWKLLYYGINFKPFTLPPDLTLRIELGLGETDFVVGHVGRFEEQKNHDLIVKMAEVAKSRNFDVRFLLIGDGSLRESVLSKVRAMGLDSYFVFVADTANIAKYMRSAMDCFVFPSRYEGLGLVAVEAQAAGLPCVISDRVPSEAIVDASLVRVLPFEDSAGTWLDAILAFRNKRVVPTLEHMGAFYSSRFNAEHCVAALANSYQQLASHQSPVAQRKAPGAIHASDNRL